MDASKWQNRICKILVKTHHDNSNSDLYAIEPMMQSGMIYCMNSCNTYIKDSILHHDLLLVIGDFDANVGNIQDGAKELLARIESIENGMTLGRGSLPFVHF